MAKKKKPVVTYILSSVMLLGFCLLFSLLSLIFIVDKIPDWIKFIVSMIFMVPILYMAFTSGRTQGEALYRECSKNSLSDIHDGNGVKPPAYKCVYHLIGFAAPLLFVLLLAMILKNNVLQGIAAVCLFPVILMFMSVHVLSLETVTWGTFAVCAPYVLLICSAFVLGYLLKIRVLRRQQSDIEGEIRMFNN